MAVLQCSARPFMHVSALVLFMRAAQAFLTSLQWQNTCCLSMPPALKVARGPNVLPMACMAVMMLQHSFALF